MEKIKSIKELNEQKAMLAARQKQAERNICLHWNDMKASLTPGSIAAAAIDKMTQHRAEEKQTADNILKSTFTYGLTLLAQKLADKADEKFKKIFKK